MTDEEVYATCAQSAITPCGDLTADGISFGILNDGTRVVCLADWRIIEGWANAMPVTGRKLTNADGRSVQFFVLPNDYVIPEQFRHVTR